MHNFFNLITFIILHKTTIMERTTSLDIIVAYHDIDRNRLLYYLIKPYSYYIGDVYCTHEFYDRGSSRYHDDCRRYDYVISYGTKDKGMLQHVITVWFCPYRVLSIVLSDINVHKLIAHYSSSISVRQINDTKRLLSDIRSASKDDITVIGMCEYTSSAFKRDRTINIDTTDVSVHTLIMQHKIIKIIISAYRKLNIIALSEVKCVIVAYNTSDSKQVIARYIHESVIGTRNDLSIRSTVLHRSTVNDDYFGLAYCHPDDANNNINKKVTITTIPYLVIFCAYNTLIVTLSNILPNIELIIAHYFNHTTLRELDVMCNIWKEIGRCNYHKFVNIILRYVYDVQFECDISKSSVMRQAYSIINTSRFDSGLPVKLADLLIQLLYDIVSYN